MTLFEGERDPRAMRARMRQAVDPGVGGIGTELLWARPGDLVQREDSPPQHETAIAALGRSWLTPNELFFVRNHLPEPTIDLARWRLEVGGRVHRPLALSLDALRGIRHLEAVHTMECAGNGRVHFAPPIPHGIAWEHGAVGTAIWGGVRLADALDLAGVRPEARHVWFEAADEPADPSRPHFLRSLPIEKAMDDVLLAYSMNGRPLPSVHGGPLRAIVPGWYGMASTKWLTRLRLESEPATGHFMTTAYRYVYPTREGTVAAPVEEMRVKSLITFPLEGARVRRGVLHVRGYAWTGSGEVLRVEVSGDNGRSWTAAHLANDVYRHAWRRFESWVEVRHTGRATVLARAIDSTGAAQPLRARPNEGGYGNNGAHRVTVEVAG